MEKETRYYYTNPMNDETRRIFLERMVNCQPFEENMVRTNITPRIVASITASAKRQILDAKSRMEQATGIKLYEKLY